MNPTTERRNGAGSRSHNRSRRCCNRDPTTMASRSRRDRLAMVVGSRLQQRRLRLCDRLPAPFLLSVVGFMNYLGVGHYFSLTVVNIVIRVPVGQKSHQMPYYSVALSGDFDVYQHARVLIVHSDA